MTALRTVDNVIINQKTSSGTKKTQPFPPAHSILRCSRQQSETFSFSDSITRLRPESNMSHLALPAQPKTPLAAERQRPN